jgi:hypothetical protein
MSRHEYLSDAVLWNHAFRDMLHTEADGIEHLDYARFNLVDPLPDPELAESSKEL